MSSILVVDDDKLLRDMLCFMLERKGHDVMVAGNGKEAEKCCRSLAFDLAIVDIIMPVQEGMETMMVLQYEYPDMKFIPMTGGGKTSSKMYLDVAKNFGFNNTLKKPFRHEEVLQAIEIAT
jgi:CheY-like chemotaxis protein